MLYAKHPGSTCWNVQTRQLRNVKSGNFLGNDGATWFKEAVVKKKVWRYCSCEMEHSKTEMKIRMLGADKDSLSDVELMPCWHPRYTNDMLTSVTMSRVSMCQDVPSKSKNTPVAISAIRPIFAVHSFACIPVMFFFSYVRAGAVMKCQAMG